MAEPQSQQKIANRTARLIQRWRLDAGLTERQLADKVGVDIDTVRRWEQRFDVRTGEPVWSMLPRLDLIRVDGDNGDPKPGKLAAALDLDWKKLARARRQDEIDRKEAKRLLRLLSDTVRKASKGEALAFATSVGAPLLLAHHQLTDALC